MKKTLVVMAAGMGSRFGGLKQITPVDEDGNFIIDYSIYDARRSGFEKVVFVIKEENLDDFQNTIGKRLQDKIEVCYAFQELEDIPISKTFPTRSKPWGTVQAILCARPFVDGPFAVVNADDFYGYQAFQTASIFLDSLSEPYTYASITYPYGVTSSKEGAVKRGVLKLEGEFIKEIIECSIDEINGEILATPLDGSDAFVIEEDTPVSMNLFAFQNDFFDLLNDYWIQFFKNDPEYLLSHEALLPDCLKENLEKGKIKIVNCPSHSKWIGMTYKSDLDMVKSELEEFKKEKIYQKHLWE